MGMVWVRTAYEWSGDGEEEHDHVHQATDDLTAWLEKIAPAA